MVVKCNQNYQKLYNGFLLWMRIMCYIGVTLRDTSRIKDMSKQQSKIILILIAILSKISYSTIKLRGVVLLLRINSIQDS